MSFLALLLSVKCFTATGQYSAMNRKALLLMSFLVASAVQTRAFAPGVGTLQSRMSQSARQFSPLRSTILLMSSSEPEGQADESSAVAPTKVAPTSGTFYDDEVSQVNANASKKHDPGSTTNGHVNLAFKM
jgi:hypothetical protein